MSERVITHPNLPTPPVRRAALPTAGRRGTWAAVNPGPVGCAARRGGEQYLEWLQIERNRPATTVRSYRQSLAKFVAFLGWHGYRLDGLDKASARALLRRYQVELADMLPNPRTRAQTLVALRQFLADAL